MLNVSAMSDSYTNLLYHIVLSTKDRRPIITPEHEVRLYDYIGGIIRRAGGISLELNGTDDHMNMTRDTFEVCSAAHSAGSIFFIA